MSTGHMINPPNMTQIKVKYRTNSMQEDKTPNKTQLQYEKTYE